MNRRVLFYVQHLLGIGHVKRAAAITRALTGHGIEVAVVLGGPPAPLADFGGADVHQLPQVRAADSSFKTLVDEFDNPIDDEWRDHRRLKLQRLFNDINPDLLMIELFPFGRYQFRFELLPLLAEINHKVPVVCSVREVLVTSSKPDRVDKISAIIEQYFDRVLVHGDQTLIPLEATFPAAAQFADKLTYTGYVTEDSPTDASADEGGGEVVVSTGSGSVGEELLRAALNARALSKLADKTWRLLAGDYLPESVFEELRSLAPSGVIIERARPDFRSLLANAALSISQGGYNTVMDVLGAKCPAVIVPFADGSEGEQTFRARELAARGLFNLLEAGDLSALSLAEAVDRTIDAFPAGNVDIDMTGAETTARLIREMM